MWEEKGYGIRIDRTPITKPLTEEQKKARARPNLEKSFDPEWISDPANQSRFNWWLDRQLVGRYDISATANQLQTKLGCQCFLDLFALSVSRMKLSEYGQIPKNTSFLVIHGEKDAIVPFSSGTNLRQVIPQASFIQTGPQPGQVPNLAFGHHWWEYFDIEVWVKVFETFLSSRENQRNGKL
ncbi:hypothetical protein HHX47_DHR9000509 [Lentinula edodes]|nr:hypothetical protein HHX47_DHR9000509 [Lentinula edodes]